MMRTRITIDGDLAERIEELRQQRDLSLKEIINLLLQDGLEHQCKPPQSRQFRVRTHRLRLRPGFDPEKLNELSEEIASKAPMGKPT